MKRVYAVNFSSTIKPFQNSSKKCDWKLRTIFIFIRHSCFRYILTTSFLPFLSRRNSARLGQRCLGNIRNCSAPPRFYFVPGRSPPPSLTSQTESLIRIPEESRKAQMRSRSLSQTQKDKSPMNNNTTKSTEKTKISSANSTHVKQQQKILRQRVS